MSRLTRGLSLLPLALALLVAACDQGRQAEDDLVERALAIHDRVITIDTHDDISPSNFTEERNYTMDLDTQVNLPKMEAGGLDVAWFVVYVGQGPLTDSAHAAATASAIAKFNAIHWLAEEKAPDRIEIAYTSDDVRRIVGEGRKVAMIGVENGYSLGTDLSNIERFHDLGARYLSLAHNGHSQLSDSNTGEEDDDWLYHGLSELGREAVAELNRTGIMIDISHPSKEAIMQMFELTRAPIIASHSSARALSDVSRNLDDEQLLALRDNGGVVQTVALDQYVNREKAERRDAVADSIRATLAEDMGIELLDRREAYRLPPDERAAYRERIAPLNEAMEARQAEIDALAPPVNVADFVDHIDYMVDLIGIDHVGISSDFDGGGGIEGWNDASESMNVTIELVRRGYTEEEIAKLWGGNLLRVLDEVQAIAREIRAEEGSEVSP